MKKIACKYVDIFISKDLFDGLMKDYSYSEVVSDLEQKVEAVISKEEAFRKYIDIYSRLKAKRRVAVLYAEEDYTTRGELAYSDGKRTNRIQGWIDKNDGKYGCLIIISCGPYYDDIKSKKSLVFMESGTSLCLFSPIVLIDAYTIDYHLKQLRKRVRANANS